MRDDALVVVVLDVIKVLVAAHAVQERRRRQVGVERAEGGEDRGRGRRGVESGEGVGLERLGGDRGEQRVELFGVQLRFGRVGWLGCCARRGRRRSAELVNSGGARRRGWWWRWRWLRLSAGEKAKNHVGCQMFVRGKVSKSFLRVEKRSEEAGNSRWS
jgi:hypothetical protein